MSARKWLLLLGFQGLVAVVFTLIVILPRFSTPSVPSQAALPLIRDPQQVLYQLEQNARASGWTSAGAAQAGDIWESLGDSSRAVPYWERAAQLEPSNAGLVQRLAQAYIQLGRWSQAQISLNQLVALRPDDGWAHYQLGLLQAVVDPARAVQQLEAAQSDPSRQAFSLELIALLQNGASDAATAAAVGALYASRDLWNYAEYAFLYAASLPDAPPEALAYAGLARDRQGKDGSTQINQAIAAAPGVAEVRYLQGLHLRLMGDYAASLDAFYRAAALEPTNPAYAAELGTAYQLAGNLGEAEIWLIAAVQLSGSDPRFQQLLDQFYAQIPSFAGG